MDNQSERTIAITATFRAEPIEESLNFWSRELEIPFKIEFAPYNQIFQQLLDSSSLIRRKKNGMSVILLRLEDWIQNDTTFLSNVNRYQKVSFGAKGLILILLARRGLSSKVKETFCDLFGCE